MPVRNPLRALAPRVKLPSASVMLAAPMIVVCLALHLSGPVTPALATDLLAFVAAALADRWLPASGVAVGVVLVVSQVLPPQWPTLAEYSALIPLASALLARRVARGRPRRGIPRRQPLGGRAGRRAPADRGPVADRVRGGVGRHGDRLRLAAGGRGGDPGAAPQAAVRDRVGAARHGGARSVADQHEPAGGRHPGAGGREGARAPAGGLRRGHQPPARHPRADAARRIRGRVPHRLDRQSRPGVPPGDGPAHPTWLRGRLLLRRSRGRAAAGHPAGAGEALPRPQAT